MAISQIGSPENFTPAYNSVYWYFDSTNKNMPGFRYIVDVYQKTGPSSQTLIKRLRIPPAPTTGYCHAEISKTLQTFLTNQLPSVSSSINASNSYLRYNLQIGEEYNTTWEYDDYEFYSSTPSDPFNGYTKLTSDPVGGGGSMNVHTFIVGDQINVAQSDGGTTKPMLQGLQTVVAVPDQYSVIINIPFSTTGSGPTIGGDVTYADNRKTIFANLLTVSDKAVFNGRLPHLEFPSYTISTFNLSTSNPAPLLTEVPDDFKVRLTTNLVTNIFNNYSTNGSYIYFENDEGTIRRASIVNTSVPVLAVGVGPNNMPSTSLVSGSGTIIQSDTQWYRYWIANGSGTRTSQYYTLNIDRTCSKYDQYELAFLDRLGSIGSFTFIYDSTIDGGISRKSSKHILGGLSGGKWTYVSTDFGIQNHNIDITQSYQLNTAWLTEDEAQYFVQLLTSPVVWIKLNGSFWPVIVEDGSYKQTTINNTKNIRYNVKVKVANDELINF